MAADTSHPGGAEMFAAKHAFWSRPHVLPRTKRLPRRCSSPNLQPDSCLEGQTPRSDNLHRSQHQPPRLKCLSHTENQSRAQNPFAARLDLQSTPEASTPWLLSARVGSGTTPETAGRGG